MSKNAILHELIDVVSGRQAHLPEARALEMHEEIDPGYNDKPLSAEEQAQLDALQARQDRLAADQAARAAAAAPAPEPAPVPAAAGDAGGF